MSEAEDPPTCLCTHLSIGFHAPDCLVHRPMIWETGSFSLPEGEGGDVLTVGKVLTLKLTGRGDEPVRCVISHIGPPAAGFVTYEVLVDPAGFYA